jgi:o-succinylbenzoate synthase
MNNLPIINFPKVKINKVDLLKKEMLLSIPFETSFGREVKLTKIFPRIEFIDENNQTTIGIGECPPNQAPWYDGECYETVSTILDNYLIPALLKRKEYFTDVEDFIVSYSWIVGHNIAKSGVEAAYWDSIGKILNKPVYKLWGGTKMAVETGSSVGLEKTDEEVISKIQLAIDKKVKRVKIKIKPGRDILLIEKIRKQFPTLPLQVDGNAAYDLEDNEQVKILQKLDDFNLMMIEQPGPNDDRFYHAKISQKIKTPICLDESILHARHAQEAIELWEQSNIKNRLIINIKPPRVGGYWEAIKIAKICGQHDIKTWCGGMLESAIGKTANLHFSSLLEINLPGDHVSQMSYFKEDVTIIPVYKNGEVYIPEGNGWGIKEIYVNLTT